MLQTRRVAISSDRCGVWGVGGGGRASGGGKVLEGEDEKDSWHQCEGRGRVAQEEKKLQEYVNFFFLLPRVYNSKFGVMPGCDVSGNPRLFFSIRQARVSCFSAPTLGLE